MYYILNETHQVIAADDSFLSYCNVAHINELSKKIAKGDIGFNIGSDETVTLILDSKEEVFSVDKVALSSLLGQLTLINISSDIANEDTSTLSALLEDKPSELIDASINDVDDTDNLEIDALEKGTTEDVLEEENLTLDDTSEDEKITFGDHLTLDDSLDDDIMSLKDETEEEGEETIPTLDLPDDDALFDLVLDDDTSKLDEQTSNEKENDVTDSLELDDTAIDFGLSDENDTSINLDAREEELSEILIDSEAISQKIGISNDDYKNFLNDFIDTALNLEKDLQSSKTDTRDDAIATLSHLSDVLHLPMVTDIISNIKDDDRQRESIESLYNTLSRITTQASDKDDLENDVLIEDVDEKLELFDEPTPEPVIQESIPARNAPKGDSFGTISLEGIKPKHFDFQLEEAANDLLLPIELIEEFVNDFIDQAHIETKKMLQAYEDGDLDTIQKIGHLLKGASSNLRINALSDTLYKIQFCEKSGDLDTLIKDYWAHFLSFETQINAISH